MKTTMIVRQTMFEFSFNRQGRLKLTGVRFLPEEMLERKDGQLLVRRNGEVQVYVSGKTPVSELTWEQFRFAAAATRFFGVLPDQPELPVWICADSRQLSSEYGHECSAEPVPEMAAHC